MNDACVPSLTGWRRDYRPPVGSLANWLHGITPRSLGSLANWWRRDYPPFTG